MEKRDNKEKKKGKEKARAKIKRSERRRGAKRKETKGNENGAKRKKTEENGATALLFSRRIMEFKTCEQYVLAQLEQLESENAKMREEMNRVEQLYAYINELKYQNENLQGQITYLRSILDKKAGEESAGAEECCGSCAGDCDGDCAG